MRKGSIMLTWYFVLLGLVFVAIVVLALMYPPEAPVIQVVRDAPSGLCLAISRADPKRVETLVVPCPKPEREEER